MTATALATPDTTTPPTARGRRGRKQQADCLCARSPLARRTLQLIGMSKASLHYQDAHVVLVARQGERLVEKVLVYDQVAATHMRVSTDTGWVPPHVKRWGSTDGTRWALHYVPPGPHRLFVPEKAEADGNERDEVIEVRLPGIIFFGLGRTYYVWCVPGRDFDHRATLIHAPLPNVYGDGRICWGNNTAPEVDERYCDAAWSIFQRSPYTSNETSKKSRRHADDVRKTLFEVARGKGRHVYPLSDLIPFKLTVEDAVNHITAGRQIPENLRR